MRGGHHRRLGVAERLGLGGLPVLLLLDHRRARLFGEGRGGPCLGERLLRRFPFGQGAVALGLQLADRGFDRAQPRRRFGSFRLRGGQVLQRFGGVGLLLGELAAAAFERVPRDAGPRRGDRRRDHRDDRDRGQDECQSAEFHPHPASSFDPATLARWRENRIASMAHAAGT